MVLDSDTGCTWHRVFLVKVKAQQQHAFLSSSNFLNSEDQVKMTAEWSNGADSSLASQCLAFCQALASHGKDFSFSLTINSTFSFSLDTRESNVKSTLAKKRSSPSTQRRNARRRREFLQKKLNFGSLSPSGSDSPADASSASTPMAAATPTSYASAVCNAPLPTTRNQRDDVDAMASPSPTLSICKRPAEGCGFFDVKECGKTFNSENDLRRHGHIEHDYCFQLQFQGKCPRPCKCLSEKWYCQYLQVG